MRPPSQATKPLNPPIFPLEQNRNPWRSFCLWGPSGSCLLTQKGTFHNLRTTSFLLSLKGPRPNHNGSCGLFSDNVLLLRPNLPRDQARTGPCAAWLSATCPLVSAMCRSVVGRSTSLLKSTVDDLTAPTPYKWPTKGNSFNPSIQPSRPVVLLCSSEPCNSQCIVGCASVFLPVVSLFFINNDTTYTVHRPNKDKDVAEIAEMLPETCRRTTHNDKVKETIVRWRPKNL
ncbi:hypothetical protein RHMOL_Rhmol11G0012400 [Rhododendron molle]|uniref:Uncharacterized protein n=1 Tax=Rhododendron molle TaxID=49168 RepID=A0ACC0LP45_RHOML|nr:hypothetical protein RHMOL_Rhmol11G0012400 [Rhododendron molle]